MSIPLCPPWRIVEAFHAIELLAQQAGIFNVLQPFFQYINNTWINGIGVAVLSVYRSRHRTTNANESYHRNLNARVGVRRPTVWRFLGILV